MDDASTNGEQEVIKQWMVQECDMNRAETIDIPTSVVIIVPHKTNVSCTFAFYLLKQNLYGTRDKKMNRVNPWREKCEYEALFEGDDYWIDPLKLKRQFIFMETHVDYSLCFHRVNVIYEEGAWGPDVFEHVQQGELSLEYMQKRWTVPTCSMFLRCSVKKKFPSIINLELEITSSF